VQIGVLGTIWSSLLVIYRLVILKNLENTTIFMKNESNQEINENFKFKITRLSMIKNYEEQLT